MTPNSLRDDDLLFDPIKAARDLSNTDQDSAALGLILDILKHKNKEKLLKEHGDTYIGISWDGFKKVLEDCELYNFELLHCREFSSSETCVWADVRHGIIIAASSDGNGFNGGTAYFQARLTRMPAGPFTIEPDNGVSTLSIPVNEGLIHWLLSVTVAGISVSPWEAKEEEDPPRVLIYWPDKKRINAEIFDEIFEKASDSEKLTFSVLRDRRI